MTTLIISPTFPNNSPNVGAEELGLNPLTIIVQSLFLLLNCFVLEPEYAANFALFSLSLFSFFFHFF